MNHICSSVAIGNHFILGIIGETKYKFGTPEVTAMSFVELNIEEDFERYNWEILANTETEFRAEYGLWTVAAYHEPGDTFYEIEAGNGHPLFVDGFPSAAEAQASIGCVESL